MNSQEYVQKVIDEEFAKLSGSEKGNRNNQLNTSAYVLGRLVGGGALSEGEAEDVLMRACELNGLVHEDVRAVKSTIRSGLRAGVSKPKYVSQQERPEFEYAYQDKEGRVVAVKVRKTKKDGSKTFIWKRYVAEKGTWAFGLKQGIYEPKIVSGEPELHKSKGNNSRDTIELNGIEVNTLYHLPEVVQAIADQKSIYLVEGEKDVETLRGQGLIATCSPHGSAPRWSQEMVESLRGANILLLSDNDEAGKKYRNFLIKTLSPIANQLIPLALPRIGLGEDITDWLQKRRGTIDELSKIATASKDVPDSVQPKLKIVTIKEFLDMEIAPKEFIIDPWLPKAGLTMIHAERGLGKTFLSLWIAAHVACGQNFFDWRIQKPRKVLYVDGEMSSILMQERLEVLSHSLPKLGGHAENLKFLCANAQDKNVEVPNLANYEGQVCLNAHVEGIELLILDSIATLMHGIDENDAQSWSPTQQWLLSLRKRGISVLLIHHDNKSGKQRGTSSKEDILDTVIHLQKLKDETCAGAAFSMQFTKNRGFCPYPELAPSIRLMKTGEGTQKWTCVINSDQEKKKKACEMHRAGKSCREIEEQLGVSKSTVNRWMQSP